MRTTEETGDPGETDTTPNITMVVRAQKLQLLFHQSFPAVFISILSAALLSAILWSVQDHTLLLTWFATLLLSALIRFFLFYLYRRKAPQGEAVLDWERPYFFTLILSSLIWGIGSVVIMPSASPLHQVAIYYFLIGMCGGAISVYSAYRKMVLWTLISVLMPATLWFFTRGDLLSICMAIGGSIFLLSASRSSRVLSMALQQNFQLNHQLQKANADAEQLARVDVLTDLYNRRAFYELGEVLTRQCERNATDFSVILMDIDHFKRINDSYGHAAGDETLRHVARIISQSLRSSDICGRIGGEEFGILLPATALNDAAAVAEKLRRLVARKPVVFAGNLFPVTASFGVAAGDYDLEKILIRADQALYQAKSVGRNCVVSSSSAQAPGSNGRTKLAVRSDPVS